VGLAWQVVWVRSFTPLFGAGMEAIAAVTAVFLGGLGLGAALAPALLRRWGGLRSYALLEAFVGIWGAGLPWALDLLAQPLLRSLIDLGEGLPASALRLGVALLLVGPPALALGATFPAVTAALQASCRPGRVGLAYGLNALGAAGGALLAGLWLPWALGLRWGSLALGCGNLAVAGLAMAWAALTRGNEPGPAQQGVARARSGLGPSATLWLLAALTGFTALAFEVSWSRLSEPLLATLFGSGQLAFACVLAAVLAGIGLGGLAGHRLGKRAASLLAALQLLLILGNLLLLEPSRVLLFGAHVRPLLEGCLPLLPALCLGASFPLLSNELFASGGSQRQLAMLYALNTCSAVVGSLLTGFWAIPQLGAQRWILVLTCLAAAVGLLGLLRDGRRRWALGWAALALPVLSLLLLRTAPVAGLRLLHPGEALVAARDGRVTTSLVARDERGGRVLISGGHRIEEGRRGAVNDHARRALVPASLLSDPQHVLVIGLGTGETAHTLLHETELSSLVVVELDERQQELLSHFGTEDILDDPRLRLVAADGRQFLRTAEHSWDLIVADAYGPRATPAFYSAEFYAEARRGLTPQGLLFVKFTPAAIHEQQVMASFLGTLFDAFPWAVLYYVDIGFSGLLGGDGPPPGLNGGSVAAEAVSGAALCAGVRRMHDHRPVSIPQARSERNAVRVLNPWWKAQGHQQPAPWARELRSKLRRKSPPPASQAAPGL